MTHHDPEKLVKLVKKESAAAKSRIIVIFSNSRYEGVLKRKKTFRVVMTDSPSGREGDSDQGPEDLRSDSKKKSAGRRLGDLFTPPPPRRPLRGLLISC